MNEFKFFERLNIILYVDYFHDINKFLDLHENLPKALKNLNF